MPFLLAQSHVTEGDAIAFGLVSLGFVVISVIILWLVDSYPPKLILLGLVTAVASIGYGGLVGSLIPSGMLLAPTLMKIGVVLVLGGVGCSLLESLRGAPPPAVTPAERPPHVP